jgi:type VI secretion system protein ImpL
VRAYDGALQVRYGALQAYSAGPGALAVDRLVAPLPTVLRDPAAAGAAALIAAQRAEAARAPPPFDAVWRTLADALAIQQQRLARRQVGSGLAELSQACQRLTADRFPFVADARRDMPMADFARLFGPQGLFDGFVRTRLAGRVDARQRPWRWLEAGSAPPPATLQAFEMADDIRRLFFPPGADLPQLRLQLTPQAMDAELLLFSADIDGQLLRYENGPRRPKPIVWPGPAASERVLLRTLPPGPSGVGAEVHEGPWALLRVLQRGGWRDGGNAAQLTVDGRTLTVELRADAPVGAALLARLATFRCPQPW